MNQSGSKDQLELKSSDKPGVFAEVASHLDRLGLKVIDKDMNRPWGGFFVIQEDQAEKFTTTFFPGIKTADLYMGGKLSPKILLVQPEKRLSWQYHFRRAEIWRVIGGKVGVVTSDTDVEDKNESLSTGETIRLAQGKRHRLVGLKGWGIVAEIWQHINPNEPSNESDIVRLQDDFGR